MASCRISAGDLSARLGGKPAGSGYIAPCPAHDDNNPSLSIWTAPDGKTAWKCHAGCPWPQVTDALAAQFPDAFENSRPRKSRGKIVATYDYTDADGNLVGQVCRLDPKSFRQRRPDGKGGWTWKLDGLQLPLYRLPQIAKANAVYIVEGEKDADALASLGLPATTNPGGAGKWREHHTQALAKKRLCIIADKDKPGREHAVKVAAALKEVAESVRIIEAPDPHKDVAAWIEGGATRDIIIEATRAAPLWKPSKIVRGHIPPEYSEESIAIEYANRHAGSLLYVSAWGKWLRWTGQVWESDDQGRGIYAIRDLCREKSEELATILEGEGKSGNPAKSVASWRMVAAVEKLAQVDPRLTASADEFDADPWALNTPGGIVNLRTAQISPHDPAARCSKITAATPGGEAPVWTRFIMRSTTGDASLSEFIQRWAGYSATGSNREHAMVFIHGPAAAGKSRFSEALRYALGTYAQTAPQELLLASKHDRHPAELARLQGARLVISAETQEGRAWDEARVKALTGGDTITARYMRQDFFEFTPILKLIVHGNHRPRLKNPDDAMRRRLLVVPFTHVVPPEERDHNLSDKLEAEAAGILQWIVNGAMSWFEDQLSPPSIVTEASDRYFEEEDAVARWIDECCVTGNRQFRMTSAAAWESWSKWCEENGENAGSQRRLTQSLERHGHRAARFHGGKRGFVEIGIKTYSEADLREG